MIWKLLPFTAPTIAMFPPIDFLWRIVAAPVRAVVQDQDPTFYPVEQLPLRYVGLGAGYSHMDYPVDAYGELLFNDRQFPELLTTLVEYQQDNKGGKIRAALRERTTSKTIPQIFIGGQYIGGATEPFGHGTLNGSDNLTGEFRIQ